jgi:hypothetical protein
MVERSGWGEKALIGERAEELEMQFRNNKRALGKIEQIHLLRPFET